MLIRVRGSYCRGFFINLLEFTQLVTGNLQQIQGGQQILAARELTFECCRVCQ